MVKKIEDEEKVKEEKKLKALEVERAALQGKEKEVEKKGNATTLPASTDHVTAPVNSTVSITTNSSSNAITTTTPFTAIAAAEKEKGKEKKVEDEDLLVTQVCTFIRHFILKK